MVSHYVRLLAVALICTAPAAAVSITGLQVVFNAGHSPDLFDDIGVTGRETATSASILASNPNDFETRLAAILGIDTGPGGATETLFLNIDYTIRFTVNANPGETWHLDVETNRSGAMTLVNDGAGAAVASMLDLTTTVTGASLDSGSLDLASAGGIASRGGGYRPFDQTATASFSGVGTSVVDLRFVFQGTSTTFFRINQGDEAAVRMGLPSGLSFFSAGDYPGIGGRTLADDGHFVRATLSAPEPGTFLAVSLGLLGLALLGRRRPEVDS